MNYRDCKYNTSGVPTFVGYCDLPKYRTETGRRLVECCQEICDDFELKEDEDNQSGWVPSLPILRKV